MATVEVTLIWNGNITRLPVLESSTFRQIAMSFLCVRTVIMGR